MPDDDAQRSFPIALPPFRLARITAEVIEDLHGSPMYYVYADDGRCIDQGIAHTADDCVAHVRERWNIEPERKERRPAKKKAKR